MCVQVLFAMMLFLEVSVFMTADGSKRTVRGVEFAALPTTLGEADVQELELAVLEQ